MEAFGLAQDDKLLQVGLTSGASFIFSTVHGLSTIAATQRKDTIEALTASQGEGGDGE